MNGVSNTQLKPKHLIRNILKRRRSMRDITQSIDKTVKRNRIKRQ